MLFQCQRYSVIKDKDVINILVLWEPLYLKSLSVSTGSNVYYKTYIFFGSEIKREIKEIFSYLSYDIIIII